MHSTTTWYGEVQNFEGETALVDTAGEGVYGEIVITCLKFSRTLKAVLRVLSSRGGDGKGEIYGDYGKQPHGKSSLERFVFTCLARMGVKRDAERTKPHLAARNAGASQKRSPVFDV